MAGLLWSRLPLLPRRLLGTDCWAAPPPRLWRCCPGHRVVIHSAALDGVLGQQDPCPGGPGAPAAFRPRPARGVCAARPWLRAGGRWLQLHSSCPRLIGPWRPGSRARWTASDLASAGLGASPRLRVRACAQVSLPADCRLQPVACLAQGPARVTCGFPFCLMTVTLSKPPSCLPQSCHWLSFHVHDFLLVGTLYLLVVPELLTPLRPPQEARCWRLVGPGALLDVRGLPRPGPLLPPAARALPALLPLFLWSLHPQPHDTCTSPRILPEGCCGSLGVGSAVGLGLPHIRHDAESPAEGAAPVRQGPSPHRPGPSAPPPRLLRCCAYRSPGSGPRDGTAGHCRGAEEWLRASPVPPAPASSGLPNGCGVGRRPPHTAEQTPGSPSGPSGRGRQAGHPRPGGQTRQSSCARPGAAPREASWLTQAQHLGCRDVNSGLPRPVLRAWGTRQHRVPGPTCPSPEVTGSRLRLTRSRAGVPWPSQRESGDPCGTLS